jgi:tetratricopeptide (TPR) repeat protein
MQSTAHATFDKLNRVLESADQAWKRRDYQQCFDQLERASLMAPANPQILLNLGHRYGLRWQMAKARSCFEKAARVSADSAEILATAARLCAEFVNQDMAEYFFRKALAHKAVSADTIARLAELYERLHRPQEAAALAARALGRDPGCPLARLTQAKLHRETGRLAEAESVLLPVLTNPNREMCVRGYYELSAVYDRQGRYDDAMAACLQAKNWLLPDAPPLLARMELVNRHLKELQDNVSTDLLGRWFDAGRETLQPLHRLAYLGGHARSGTTLLEQALDAHPEIISAEETTIFHNQAYETLRSTVPNEATMFAGLAGASVDALRTARERYFQSMSDCLGVPLDSRLFVDKNPSLQTLIILFIRFFPEARLMIALRDPRDVVISCFLLPHWPLSAGSVPFLNLEATVKAYSRAMGNWQMLKHMVKNPWLEIRYEDMLDDLESVLRKSLDFLGVGWDAKVLGFDEHARKKMLRSPTYSDVAQPVYRRARGRWRNYQKYLEPHLEMLEPLVKAFGYE